MEAHRREFKLGKLVVKGNKVEFRPESSYAFEAKVGDRGGFYLQYGYRETSPHRETFNLRFTVALEGQTLGTKVVRVDDAPVMRDEEWGLLEHLHTFQRKGEYTGRYDVQGSYEMTSWWRRLFMSRTPIQKGGEFRVIVR